MRKIVYSLVLMSFLLVGCGDDAVEVITDILDPDAPVLGSIGDKSVLAGNPLVFTVRASDVNGDSLEFSATAIIGTDPRTLPSAAVFAPNQDQVSADFSWTPGTGEEGDYVMQFTVTDTSLAQLSDSETITISVVDTIELGRILYRDNCGDCHGFEGQAGSEFGIAAPTAAEIEEAFEISPSGSTMNNFAGVFTLPERQSMYEYLCTLPENNLC